MAVWVCTQCGFEKEGRCKPRKCPECDGTEFKKKEEGAAAGAAGVASEDGTTGAAGASAAATTKPRSTRKASR